MKHYSDQLSELLGRDIEIWEGVGSHRHPSIVYELIVTNNPMMRYVGQTRNLGRRMESHRYKLENFSKSCSVHDDIRKYVDCFFELTVKLHAIPKEFCNMSNGQQITSRVNLFERWMIHNYGTLNRSKPKVIQRKQDKVIIEWFEKSLA